MNTLTKINVLDNCTSNLNFVSNKITNVIENQKKKLAYNYFNNNAYVQDYIKKIGSTTEWDYCEIEYDWLKRVLNFDFTQIPENLHENLKEYMQDEHYFYFFEDNYTKGFSIDSTDNIYISYDNEIFADFSKKSYKFSNSLDEFIKIELLMQEHGIYPDIVELGYYGEYYSDYKLPKEYEFLKTCIKENEKKLVSILQDMRDIFDCGTDLSCEDGNKIIDAFTPDFINKINDNIRVDLYDIELSDNFDLTLEYCIPTKLKEKDLQKLNVQYSYTKYNETIITIKANIKDWLKENI